MAFSLARNLNPHLKGNFSPYLKSSFSPPLLFAFTIIIVFKGKSDNPATNLLCCLPLPLLSSTMFIRLSPSWYPNSGTTSTDLCSAFELPVHSITHSFPYVYSLPRASSRPFHVAFSHPPSQLITCHPTLTSFSLPVPSMLQLHVLLGQLSSVLLLPL